MAPEQPDSAGLQVVADETHLEVAREHEQKELDQREPIDYFAKDGKILSPTLLGDGQKVPFASTGRDSKMFDPRSPAGSSNLSEEKQLSHGIFAQEPFAGSTHHASSVTARLTQSKRRLWILIAILTLIICIAVAVPVGVVFGRRVATSNSGDLADPETEPVDSSSSPANGTSLTSIAPLDGSDALWLFWQTQSGDIRRSRLSKSGNWQPSESMNISGAANYSSLAAIQHGTGKDPIGWNHLVYYTTERRYADILNDPTQNSTWQPGMLYNENITGPANPRFEMDWAETSNGTSWLFNVGGNFGWRNAYAYDATVKEWVSDGRSVFGGTNGLGGVSVQEYRSVTQMKVVNDHQQIIPWVRDLSNNSTNTNWVRLAEPIVGLYPNTSLTAPRNGGANPVLYYQGTNTSIAAVTSIGYNASTKWGTQMDLGVPAMGGTTLHVSAVVLGDATQETILLFLQEFGDDITIYMSNGTDFKRNGTITA